jgi:hypothetical protein
MTNPMLQTFKKQKGSMNRMWASGLLHKKYEKHIFLRSIQEGKQRHCHEIV